MSVLRWRTSALTILCRMGNRYAAVLPVPVWAQAIRSCLSRITGMACSWMGVAFLNPIESRLSVILASKLNSWKFNRYKSTNLRSFFDLLYIHVALLVELDHPEKVQNL